MVVRPRRVGRPEDGTNGVRDHRPVPNPKLGNTPMQSATTQTPTTPTRRAALGLSVAAIVAGRAAATSPDAAIIALCHRLVALEDEVTALCAQRLTIADEQRTEPALIAIETRRETAVAELERLGPPETMAGIQAVARASLATHSHKDNKGNVVPICDGHWMALVVCECLAV